MAAMGKHGARVVDDPGSQPPERRRQRRRATIDGVESTGGRRVDPDRRGRAEAPQPTADAALDEGPGPGAAALDEDPAPGAADPVVDVVPPAAVADQALDGDADADADADADGPSLGDGPPREATDDTVTWRRPPTITSFGGLTEPAAAEAEAAAAEAEAEAEALAEIREPWLPMLEDRSPDPAVCPFLRAVAAGGDRDPLGPPLETPDARNRCAAMIDAVPQSLRQQELVCLTSGHVNCPRYLRGAAGVVEPVRQTTRTGSTFSPAILLSVAVLVAAFAASLAFVSARGGLAIEPLVTERPSASVVAQASPTADPTTVPSATPSPTPEPTPTPSQTSEPTPTPTPDPTPTPTPTPEPTPEPTPTPRPTSDRYRLLEPCPDAPDCWIYTVRSGDNLFSIANYFGVSLESIYARNPWAESTPLRAGQELRLPPPTR